MTALNRRRFMRLAAGGTATMSMLASSIARAAAIPANRRTGTLRDVEHIVVLMQENRSFDHYFGTLRGVRGYGDPRTVTLPSGKPVWYQSDGTRDVLPFHPTAANLGLQFLEDLAHDWNSTHQAWNQGKYDQWIPAKSATTMAYLTRDDIPFHYALADAFTICDAYHCSILSSTDPNRYYMWTGYVGNDGKGGGPVIDNAEVGYSWTTYPERLQQAGVSWKMYQDIGTGLDAAGSWGWTSDAYIGNYGDTSTLYFTQYQGDALYEKARRGTNIGVPGTPFEALFTDLRNDVRNDRLPQISWIVAPEAFSEHGNWPANYGAWYVSQVLDALTSNPEVWSKTALFLTYDENDGFFDHVVPAVPPTPVSPGKSTVAIENEYYDPSVLAEPNSSYAAGPCGLGVRVPMLVVSPWSTGGWVNSQVFDHTSIIRFMEQRFGVHEPNITDWRRTVCGDLTTAFDFARSDTRVPALPSTSGYVPPDQNRHQSYVPTLPANPELPAQEPGVRPARAIPYDLAVDGRVNGGGLTLEFASHGGAGAAYQVTSPVQTGGPWSYTVGSRARISDSWSLTAGTAYDLTAYGPNGFTRRFAGHAAAGPEVVAETEAEGCVLTLTLTNAGSSPVRLTVTDAYGNEPPATHLVRPGAHVRHVAPLERSFGWYDLTVTSSGDSAYVRHLTGHIENGRPSFSDPAIGA
jgi:phospholipase C